MHSFMRVSIRTPVKNFVIIMLYLLCHFPCRYEILGRYLVSDLLLLLALDYHHYLIAGRRIDKLLQELHSNCGSHDGW